MNLRVTVGQYYPIESVIHALDPRVKLLGSFTFITMIFFAESFFANLFCAFFIFSVTFASRVPFMLFLKGLKNILFILLFTLVLNIFLTPGEHCIFQIGIIKITREGLFLAVKMAVRLVLLIISSACLTLTTPPLSLASAFEFFLSPFARFGLPAQEISMMMTIALRFIPTLTDETDKIIKAQKARGADFETGGVKKRARALVPVLVPLFVSCFKRAEDLAYAMEARCYRTDIKRSKMNGLKFIKKDFAALGVIAVFAAGLLVIRKY